MNTIQKQRTKMLTLGALLTALGILIPFVMPIKVVIGPASFTLASHVPVMIAMFFSPWMAGLVSIGTTFGFMLALPVPTIWLRALTHLIFSVLGAIYLKKRPETLVQKKRCWLFNFAIGVIHAVAEVLIVFGFYTFGFGHMESTELLNFLLLIGFGTVLHSMVDFQVSVVLARSLSKVFPITLFQEIRMRRTIAS